MFLFTVEATFSITGRGLILTPGLGDKEAAPGDLIRIVRPDQSVLETTIKAISFNRFRDILVGDGLTKADIPPGSEVWLLTKPEAP